MAVGAPEEAADGVPVEEAPSPVGRERLRRAFAAATAALAVAVGNDADEEAPDDEGRMVGRVDTVEGGREGVSRGREEGVGGTDLRCSTDRAWHG